MGPEPENPLFPPTPGNTNPDANMQPETNPEDSIPNADTVNTDEPLLNTNTVAEQPIVLHTCGYSLLITDTYCPSCGLEVKPHIVYKNIFTSRPMFILLGYYAFCFALWLSLKVGDIVESLSDFYIVELVDAIVTVAFALVGIKTLLPLYSFKNVNVKRLLIYSFLAILGSVAVNYITTLMQVNLLESDVRFSDGFYQADNPFLAMVLSMAVFPAVFEEMAFRGFLYNSIQKLADYKSAIWVSSLLFAIIHFAFLSLFWLIPFAVIAATLRHKHNTLWYGMAIHFIFNLTACFIDYYQLF
jgi:membrane protease YdiL (CAAX protease family)